MNYQQNDRTQSEYNMAFSYLNRLNNLFYIADESAMSLNAHQWFHALLALYRELITEMKPDEEEQLKQLMPKINYYLAQNNKTIMKTGTTAITPELYKDLHDFEIIIRRVMKSSGLLLKMQEDPGLALK